MQNRDPRITFADFVLRFTALLALTIAVLGGVAVRAREAAPVRPDAKASAVAARESATDIIGGRYPRVLPDTQTRP